MILAKDGTFDFEESAQQGSLERERALLEQYGVEYTCLIAGGSL